MEEVLRDEVGDVGGRKYGDAVRYVVGEGM